MSCSDIHVIERTAGSPGKLTAKKSVGLLNWMNAWAEAREDAARINAAAINEFRRIGTPAAALDSASAGGATSSARNRRLSTASRSGFRGPPGWPRGLRAT